MIYKKYEDVSLLLEDGRAIKVPTASNPNVVYTVAGIILRTHKDVQKAFNALLKVEYSNRGTEQNYIIDYDLGCWTEKINSLPSFSSSLDAAAYKPTDPNEKDSVALDPNITKIIMQYIEPEASAKEIINYYKVCTDDERSTINEMLEGWCNVDLSSSPLINVS